MIPTKEPSLMHVATALLIVLLLVPSGAHSQLFRSADHNQRCDDDADTWSSPVAPLFDPDAPFAQAHTCVEGELWWVLGAFHSTVLLNDLVSDPLGQSPVLYEPGAEILRDAWPCQAESDDEVPEVLHDECGNTDEMRTVFNAPNGCTAPGTTSATQQTGVDVTIHYTITSTVIAGPSWGWMRYHGFPSPYWTGDDVLAYPSALKGTSLYVYVDQINACDAYDATSNGVADPATGITTYYLNGTAPLFADHVSDTVRY